MGVAKAIGFSVAAAGIALAGFSVWAGTRPPEQKLELPAASMHAPRNRVLHLGDGIGMMQVPRLGLVVPIVEGSDDASLESGAGHVPRTALPGTAGNAGIAAHRDTCFRPLRFIQSGDEILIATRYGASRYVVDGTRIVLPSDGKVLHRSRRRELTLVTCYPFFSVGNAPKRFIVHATAG